MRIDHVIYATLDLEAAAMRIEDELGLPSIPGGHHVELGTENRIVSLGGGYLELLAPAAEQDPAPSELGQALQALIARSAETLLAWAVAVDDVKGVAARLGTEVLPLTREGFTGRLTGVAEALRNPTLPFFIERDPGVADPGSAGDAGGLTWIELSGDPRTLRDWVDGAELPLRIVEGDAGIPAIGIGDREFRPGRPTIT